jgi:hypothetical protein
MDLSPVMMIRDGYGRLSFLACLQGPESMAIPLTLTPPSCSSFFSCTNAHRAFKDQLDRIYHLSLPGPPSRLVGVGMGTGMASMVRLAGLDLAVPASP